MNRMRLIKLASVFVLAIVSTLIITATYNEVDANQSSYGVFLTDTILEDENNGDSTNERVMSQSLGTHENEKLNYNVRLEFVNGDIFNNLLLINDSSHTLFYLNEFIVEQNIDGTWYMLPQPSSVVFSDYGLYVIPNSTSVVTTRFVDDFNLTSGQYRLVMNVSIFDEVRQQLTDRTHDLAIEFTIN